MLHLCVAARTIIPTPHNFDFLLKNEYNILNAKLAFSIEKLQCKLCAKVCNADNFEVHMSKIHKRPMSANDSIVWACGDKSKVSKNSDKWPVAAIGGQPEVSNVSTINLDGIIVATVDGQLNDQYDDDAAGGAASYRAAWARTTKLGAAMFRVDRRTKGSRKPKNFIKN
jgi:hypothetical protein